MNDLDQDDVETAFDKKTKPDAKDAKAGEDGEQLVIK